MALLNRTTVVCVMTRQHIVIGLVHINPTMITSRYLVALNVILKNDVMDKISAQHLRCE